VRTGLKNHRERMALNPRVRLISDANGGLGTARPTGEIRGRARSRVGRDAVLRNPDRAVWANPAASEGLQSPVSNLQSCRAFTLVELMAVAVTIGILVAVVIGTAKYANLRIGIAQAKTQLAALQMGLELYKADVGYYPASTIVRFSYSGSAEVSNAAILYRALTQSKRYYNARRSDIGAVGVFTYFKDPWGTPWHYYRPVPAQLTSFLASINAGNVSYYITNGNYASFVVGGQKNLLTYDLYSYGPDTITTIPGAANPSWGSPYYYAWLFTDQTTSGHDTDDIGNWK